MPTPFVPFVRTAEVTARYFLSSQPVENVYHFTGTADWTSTLLAALSSAFIAWEVANARAHRGTATQLHEVVSVDLTATDSEWDASTTATDGTLADVQLPNNCSLAVKAITAKRGRSFRGRTYWIGLVEGDLSSTDANTIANSRAAAIQAAMRSLLTTTWPNSAVPVVASRRHNGAWRTTGLTTPIKDYVLTDQVIDSQRRRLPFHNVHR